MNIVNNKKHYLVVLFFVMFLVACGSGTETSTPAQGAVDTGGDIDRTTSPFKLLGSYKSLIEIPKVGNYTLKLKLTQSMNIYMILIGGMALQIKM
ncbi:hypothetical protein [Pseudoalteromonas sp. T1lg24]|uniref:hypothetical protein n=1 Tax=Pseudoalteromonas sp. T1lg24 TaxID=2077099 RepID=UPI000CF70F3A|nr:hypothetical protein [Pseudoalteromonas sp. T1lg24]